MSDETRTESTWPPEAPLESPAAPVNAPPAAASAGRQAGGAAYVQELHLADYARTVYRHRWIAVTTFAIIFVGVAIYTFIATPVYEGRVQLLLDPAKPNVMKFDDVNQSSFLSEQDFYQTQVTILRSRGLARRTIEALTLWDSEELDAEAAEAKGSGIGAGLRSAATWIGSLFSSAGNDARAADARETARQSRVVDAFLEALAVAPIRNSSLVDVRFASRSPAKAAAVANELARQYIDQNLESKFLSTKEASDWLSGQLAVERKKLEESEQALQRYREKGDAVALEDRQNIVVQRLADLNAAYTQARTDRFEKEALYNQLKSLQSDRSALDTFPAILSNTFIQQLKTQLADLQRQQAQMAERLGEKHPDMIKLSSAIENTEAKLAGRTRQGGAVGAERVPVGAGEGAEPGGRAGEPEGGRPVAEPEGHRVRRAAPRGREQQADVRGAAPARQGNRDLGRVEGEQHPRGRSGRNAPTARPAEEEPQPAAGPPRRRRGRASAWPSFVEYLDNRIKNPDEISQFLGLSFLGLVPSVA